MPDVLIGYSACQLTRSAFEQAGCRAWTCDLLPARGDWHARHIQGDVWAALRSHQWSMAVLHPMCTYLTVSAAWAYKEPPYHIKVAPGVVTGQARVKARDDAIRNFLALLDLPFPVAIENPGSSFLPVRPSQIVHPYQFGDDASKGTGFWLTHGVPLLTPTRYHPPRLVVGSDGRIRQRWGNQTDNGNPRLPPSEDRWLQRSQTWPGMAAAMGDQWGRWLRG